MNSNAKKDKTLKSLVLVVLTNVLIGVSGIAAGFFVPKALGVNGYGYYKLFSLYGSYASFLLFGVTNGIYLNYAGRSRSDISIEKMRFVSRSVIISQFLIAVLLGFVSFIFIPFDTNIFLIVISLGLYVLFFNVLNYFTIVAQSTLEFNKIILKNVVSGSLSLIFSISIFVLYKITGVYVKFEIYLALILLLYFALAFWISTEYRTLIFGKTCSWKEGLIEIKDLVRLGIVMMIANFISSIFLHIDLQFVSILFPIDVFSVYSFAYSIVSLIITVVASASTVLYPALKTLSLDRATANFSHVISVISCLVSFFQVAFFFVSYIIKIFLPEYEASIEYLSVLFPTIMPITLVRICLFNYFQAYKKVFHSLFINLFIFIFSILLNYLFYSLFKTPKSISIASVVCLTLYYFIYLHFAKRIMCVKTFKNCLFVMSNLSLFYLFYGVSGFNLKCAVCIFLLNVILCFVFYSKELLDIFYKRFKRRCDG